MKVLLVNWSWYPSGGDWTYIQNLQSLYERQGHEIIALSTENEKNVTTDHPAYFIDSPDYKLLNKKKTLKNSVRAVTNSVVSRKALKKIDEILQAHKIDVAHLHNIHHYITPAIIWKLKKAGVKVIWTLHDYKIICPESLFLSHGKVCEKCIGGSFYHCTTNRCKKNSLPASMLASADAYFYHSSGVYNKVDAFLCPSSFLKSKFRQFGFNELRLHVTNLCYDIPLIDNFIKENKKPDDSLSKSTRENYILYVGRLEEIKGIRTLVNAIEGTGLTLKIVGSGALEEELKTQVHSRNLSNVEFLGFQNKQSVFDLTMNCRFVVCPSVCYENYPFSVIETFLFSRPVVGSKIGGIPELIIDGETGFLFEPGNADQLRDRMMQLWNDESLVERLGTRAREYVHDLVNFDTHWNKINSIINSITTNGN